MTLKLNALMAALAVIAAGGAQASLIGGTSAPQENGSVAFVAIDNTGSPISLTVDLGYNFSDFIEGSVYNTPGTEIVWNFTTNTRTLNGVATVGDFAWSAAFTDYLATAQANETRWGVISVDGVNGGTIPGRGVLASGNATQLQMTNMATSGPVGNIIGNTANYYAPVNNTGTHPTNAEGAGTAVSGGAYQGNSTMNGNFGGNLTWSYLTANGQTSTFQRLNQLVANPVVVQLGQVNTTDSLSSSPATFLFDASAGTLTYAVPVPEPGTYAMMFAGLAAVGFMVRRRRV